MGRGQGEVPRRKNFLGRMFAQRKNNESRAARERMKWGKLTQLSSSRREQTNRFENTQNEKEREARTTGRTPVAVFFSCFSFWGTN